MEVVHIDGDSFKIMNQHIGGGWFVYRSKNRFLNSLRWKELRNGLQDYEYFKLLEDKIFELKDSLGTRFSWINPKQRGQEIAGKVVNSFLQHTNDPKVFYEVRKKVLDEVLELKLSLSPGVYIQINPSEGVALPNGTPIEVIGWTEPGTTVILNGKMLPVSEERLFLEQIAISPKGQDVIVTVSKDGVAKKIVRNFQLLLN